MLGLVNLLLVLFEIPFLYYVVKISSEYFMASYTEEHPNEESHREIYSLLLVLLLLFTLILLGSSLTFTVYGFKVFCKLIYFSREIVLIIPMSSLEETLELTV